MTLFSNPLFKRLTVFIVSALVLTSCSNTPPVELGLKDGRLKPCPNTPNCVISYSTADEAQKVLALRWDSTEHPTQHIQETINATGGSVQTTQTHYIWAVYRSTIFRFVDDVEFHWIPEDQTIHIRSASRVGYSDFGANRKRIQNIHKHWSKGGAHE